MKNNKNIETVLFCPVCKKTGNIKYRNVNGSLYKKSVGYELSTCIDGECGCSWLSKRIKEEFVHEAYDLYPTHQKKQNEDGLKQKIRNYIKDSYLSKKYGYKCTNSRFGYFLANLIAFIIPSGTHGIDSECFYIKNQENKKVLEIGCGNGINLLKLKKLGYDVTGIEIDPRSARVAQECGLNIICTSIEEFIPSEKYSIILMHHVIEHLYDLDKALNIIRSSLNDGGTIYIFTPNSDSIGEALYKQDWFPLDPPRHVTLFTKKSISNLIIKSGFSNVVTFTSIKDSLPYHVFSSQIKIKKTTSLNLRESIISLIFGFTTSFIEKLIYSFDNEKGGELICIAKK